MVLVDVQVAEQDDVVFAAAIVAHGAIHVVQRVELLVGFVGIGVDVDQRKGECLLGGGPRTRNQPTSGSRCRRSSGS